MEDHREFTSGQTIADRVFCNLSAVLLCDRDTGAIFQTFQIGRDNLYYRDFSRPLFPAQLGRMDEEESDGKPRYKKPTAGF